LTSPGGRSTSPDPACRAAFLRDRGRSGGPIAVGVSGGADSIHLLDALRAFVPEGELLVLHVDHRARPDAAEDAAWLERECRTRGVRCRILVADRERIL